MRLRWTRIRGHPCSGCNMSDESIDRGASVDSMSDQMVFYFAYGSNADPDRFRSRVGLWRSCSAAGLEGYGLRFAASVQSEGGGGAVIDEASEGTVDGVLYEITPEQMAAMDREEFDQSRDTDGKGRRLTVTVSTEQAPRVAECYTVRDDGAWRALVTARRLSESSSLYWIRPCACSLTAGEARRGCSHSTVIQPN